MSGATEDPRRLAWRILTERRRGRVALDPDRLAPLDPAARHRVTDLVQGVRRHTFLLDAILRSYLERPIRLVSPPAREALRLGLYELLFRPEAPRGGIVSHAVDLAGRRKVLRGLVNAVLRSITKELGHERPAPDRDAITDRHGVWIAPGLVARFDRAVLPDPRRDRLRWASQHYSLTEEFVAAMLEELPLESDALFRSLVARRPITLRPVGQSDGLIDALIEEGVRPLRWCGPVLEVKTPGSPGELSLVREGRVVIQDRHAAEVAPFVAPLPGERILDLCAAPGGKTAHLAELIDDTGEIVAVDRDGPRLDRLRESMERFGWRSVRIATSESDAVERGAPFDRALVDAPCSNTGVLMKRVDARYRVHQEELGRLRKVQMELLDRAAAALRPGATLIYSTCSILPVENGGLVRDWMSDREGLRLEEERLRLPHRTGRDGGYAARIRKD